RRPRRGRGPRGARASRRPDRGPGRHPTARRRARNGGSGSRPAPRRWPRSGWRRSWAGSRRTGPIRGSAGSSGWTLGTPFFPLVQSGLDGLGPDLVDPVSDIELGRSEDLAVGLGGQRLGEGAEVGLDGLPQGLIDALGFLGLLGGQRRRRHGGPP